MSHWDTLPCVRLPLILALVVVATSWGPKEGADLVGTRAPALSSDIQWLWGGPLTQEELEGKVVLLRFWLIGCPYCKATAPALVELHEEYADQGLLVVGLHHPKSDVARDPEVVRKAAKRYGFEFPVGMDNDWTTIRAYGTGTTFTRFTSLSFLIDREGNIAFVHDGGEFHTGGGKKHADCNAAYQALREKIEQLL